MAMWMASVRSKEWMLEVCLRLGVHCVTVYSFSIENFKRPKEEVDGLMDLFKDRMQELCREEELLSEYGVRLNIIGRIELLPPELQQIIRDTKHLTRHHDRAILNVCMPYTSRDEITTAIQSSIQRYYDGKITLDEITEEEIGSQLATSLAHSPPLDMLIRTSGVSRLSDFLLWQACENTQIHFTSTYWPDFSLWEFVPMLFDYQRKVWATGQDVQHGGGDISQPKTAH